MHALCVVLLVKILTKTPFHQWSYGVTCWEVFTCGRVPYTGVPVTTLLSELHSGHRLERPTNITCSNEMYSKLSEKKTKYFMVFVQVGDNEIMLACGS